MNRNNIRLVWAREYLIRVKKKSFWIGTLLAPLLLAAATMLPTVFLIMQDPEYAEVYVYDPAAKLGPALTRASTPDIKFITTDQPLDSLKPILMDNDQAAYLVLPQSVDKDNLTATYYAGTSPGIKTESGVRSKIKDALRELRIATAGLDEADLEALDFELDFRTKKVSAEDEQATSTLLATGMGYVMAFIIYFLIMITGNQVMMTVLEEKSSRIIEVIVSSVKPLELFIGKIVAAISVSVTQMSVWVALYLAITTVLGLVLASLGADASQTPQMGGDPKLDPEQLRQIQEVLQGLQQFGLADLLLLFLYLVGGLLVYAAMMAALAAPAEELQDLQSVTWVAYMPLILAIVFIGAVAANPNGGLAVFVSHFPLLSPVNMPLRMFATEVPWWELGLSLLLLYGGALGLVWVSARVYRAGLLLYGKKPKVLDLFRYALKG